MSINKPYHQMKFSIISKTPTEKGGVGESYPYAEDCVF